MTTPRRQPVTAGRRQRPGLAAERTSLAWLRSLTGLIGVTLLAGRAVLTHWPLPAAAIGLGLAGAAVASGVFLGERRFAALRRQRPGPPHPAVIVTVTGGTLLTAVLGGAALYH